MSVDPEISRKIIEEELAPMQPLITSYGWGVATDPTNLLVTVRMISAVDKEVFIVEAKCNEYKELPPYFEFIHPETGERGTQRCYPFDGSFFHSTPCICVQWNRKAYSVNGGPHSDWQMANWMSYRPGMTLLGDMFHLIQRRINNQGGQYRGRMAH